MKYKINDKYLIALSDGRDAAIIITDIKDNIYVISGKSCCGFIYEEVTEQFLDDSIVRGAI